MEIKYTVIQTLLLIYTTFLFYHLMSKLSMHIFYKFILMILYFMHIFAE